MAESLKKKTAKSVGWGFVETLSTYAVRFVIGIILARLLTPNDYGLIGMVTVFIVVSDTIINSGFGQAYVQKKDADELDADTVFFTNFGISILLYIIFWISAPLIAHFFRQEILISIIRVLFIILIINAFNVIQLSIIQKELLFRKRAILTFICSMLSGVIGIICAYRGLGVWSLVIQQIANRILLCFLFYRYSTWKLRFRFSFARAKKLFSFGGWILLSNIIISSFSQFYKFFIGRWYNSIVLGLYERANQFESLISQNIVTIFGQVAFPVYSKIQDNFNEIREHTRSFIKYSSFIIYPLLTILFISSKPIIILLLTDKWIACVPLLKCFCFVGLLHPLTAFYNPLMQSIGKSKFSMWFNLLSCFGRIVNAILSLNYGIEFLIIGEFFVQLIVVIMFSIIMKPVIKFSYLFCGRSLLLNLLTAVVSGLIGYFICIQFCSELLQVIVSSIAIIVSYTIIEYYFDKKAFVKIKALIINKI